jgi:putative membrane protein insertion efficiency factor
MTVSDSRSARSLLRAINVYQQLSAHRPSPCRFIPSCSEYAREAVIEHGAGRGAWLSVRRLSRCHPLGGRGFDPVPARSDGPARSNPNVTNTKIRGHAC